MNFLVRVARRPGTDSLCTVVADGAGEDVPEEELRVHSGRHPRTVSVRHPLRQAHRAPRAAEQSRGGSHCHG